MRRTSSQAASKAYAEAVMTGSIRHWSGVSRSGLTWSIHQGDALQVLKALPAETFDCIVTSPPYYWQRDYGVTGQLGLEPTIVDYVTTLVAVMAEARRVLKREGTLFLNLGDTYYSGKGEPKGIDKKSAKRRFGLRAVDASGLGVPPKTIIGIPWRVALAMIDDGWILRSPIVWERKDCLSEPSAKDRPWRTYEHVFMFVKSRHYHFRRDALQGHEDVWRIAARTKANGLRTAPFPEQLVRRCLSVGCIEGGRILDPFAGSGTALRAALEGGRHAVGIDLSPDFCEYAAEHLLRS